MVTAAKVAKVKNGNVGNNEELKEYLTNLRAVLYELYIDIHFTAEVLQANLRSVRGVKNSIRARLIAGTLRKAAELCKLAAGQSTATWVQFEQRFNAELAAAPKKAKVEKFKIV